MARRYAAAAWCFGLAGCGHAPSPVDSPRAPSARVCYRGTQQLAGHLEKPGETQRVEMALELYRSDQYVVSTWSASAPDERDLEHVWVREGQVVRAAPGALAEAASAWEAAWARKLAALGTTSQRVAHATFGDVLEQIQPDDSGSLDGVLAPSNLRLGHATESTRWSAALERVRCAQPTAASALPQLAPPRAAMHEITWSRLADRVELASLHDSQIVSLVVELSDSLLVCESGLTVQQGEQLVDALAQRFPSKPVAHVFFGHHHPHYTGGLRAFIAAGAVIHAPAHNARFVEQLAALPFELSPDRLAQRKVSPRIEPFTGKVALQDERGIALEAIDIGKESNHTEEYVVFYLPRHKLLFQGDLGWFPEANGQIRASRRAPGLLRAIASRGLLVETLAQSWPIMASQQTISPTELEAAIRR